MILPANWSKAKVIQYLQIGHESHDDSLVAVSLPQLAALSLAQNKSRISLDSTRFSLDLRLTRRKEALGCFTRRGARQFLFRFGLQIQIGDIETSVSVNTIFFVQLLGQFFVIRQQFR